MSTPTPLEHLKALIIRPAQQAQSLCAKLTKLGGRPILFPTIAIEAIPDPENLLRQIQPLANYDLAIFVSPNAVEKALTFLQPQWLQTLKIAAIGPGTAQALRNHQLTVAFCPVDQFNTEGLLSLPELQNLKHKAILLFRGEHGRELLATTLEQRGAQVTKAVVYRQVLPSLDICALLSNRPDILICTSQTSLENLTVLVGKTNRQWLLNMSLLVSSQRLAELAQTLGFRKPAFIADNASDDALIKTLIIWREKHHGTTKTSSTL